MQIVLASSSLGRKKILEQLGLDFQVIPADIDEGKIVRKNPHLSPTALLKKIAKEKALAVIERLKKRKSEKQIKSFSVPPFLGFLVISADSMVLFRGKLYGKPRSCKEAERLLKMLSGQTHWFMTGLCLIDSTTAKIYQSSSKTKVIFDKFTQKEINEYVKSAAVTTHAGAYSTDDELIKKKCRLIGSETNVVGLPLEILLPILKKYSLL